MSYAFFDPKSTRSPNHENCEVDLKANGFYASAQADSEAGLEDTLVSDQVDSVPDHVLSVKSLHSNSMNKNVIVPSANLDCDPSHASVEEFASQGEGNHVPEHSMIDLTHSKQQIEQLKTLAAESIDEPT
jgi:hypothetical protein